MQQSPNPTLPAQDKFSWAKKKTLQSWPGIEGVWFVWILENEWNRWKLAHFILYMHERAELLIYPTKDDICMNTAHPATLDCSNKHCVYLWHVLSLLPAHSIQQAWRSYRQEKVCRMTEGISLLHSHPRQPVWRQPSQRTDSRQRATLTGKIKRPPSDCVQTKPSPRRRDCFVAEPDRWAVIPHGSCRCSALLAWRPRPTHRGSADDAKCQRKPSKGRVVRRQSRQPQHQTSPHQRIFQRAAVLCRRQRSQAASCGKRWHRAGVEWTRKSGRCWWCKHRQPWTWGRTRWRAGTKCKHLLQDCRKVAA